MPRDSGNAARRTFPLPTARTLHSPAPRLCFLLDSTSNIIQKDKGKTYMITSLCHHQSADRRTARFILILHVLFSLLFFFLFFSSSGRCSTYWSTLALTRPSTKTEIEPTSASFPITCFYFHSLSTSFFAPQEHFFKTFQTKKKLRSKDD